MKTSNSLIWLVGLIAVLALIATGSGLFWADGGQSFTFTTVRGEQVEIYGRGLYRYDTPIAALGFQGADLVTLLLALPFLVFCTLRYRRGSLRGGLALAGVMAYLLYNYISMAFGTAYNALYLVYVALLAATLFAFVLALLSFEVAALPAHFSPHVPRRRIGLFLIVTGVLLLLVWLGLSILPALLQGKTPPEVSYYTTFTTGVLDMGIVAPELIVAGVLWLRRAPLGYLLAATLLIMAVLIGPNLAAGAILQLQHGVISMGQALGMTAPFVLMSLVAIGYTVALFRNFSESAARQAQESRLAHA